MSLELMVIATTFLVLVGVLLGVFTYARTRARRAAAMFQIEAQRLGLTYLPGGDQPHHLGQIRGELDGRRVAVYLMRADRKAWTAVETYHAAPLEIGLRIERSETLTEVSKALGAQDIDTGDADFDRRFVVKADRVDGALELLDADLRAAILRFDREIGSTWIDDRCIRSLRRGMMIDGQDLERILRAQAEVSRVAGEATSAREMAEQPVWSVAEVKRGA